MVLWENVQDYIVLAQFVIHIYEVRDLMVLLSANKIYK